jgi:hypothetical protein
MIRGIEKKQNEGASGYIHENTGPITPYTRELTLGA